MGVLNICQPFMRSLAFLTMELSKEEYKRLVNWSGTDKKGRIKASKDDVDYILKGRNAARQSKSRRDSVKEGYRSNFEKKVADKLRGSGIDYKYEPFTIEYTIKPTIKCVCAKCGGNDVLEVHNYLPDFVIGNIYIEAKGEFTAKDRKKMKAIIGQYPNKIFLIVFQRDNKLSSKSKNTYMSWCKKEGINSCTFEHMIANVINYLHTNGQNYV